MAKRARRGGKSSGSGRLWALLGLGSAAVLGGLYLVGSKERDGGHRSRKIPARTPPPPAPRLSRVAGPAGALELLQTASPPWAVSGRLPILFVHGLAGNARQWEPLMLRLPPAQQAAALSLRGHGASEPAGDYSITALAEDVQAAAEALGFERYVLVAHSLGATVAAAHAAEHPGRVAGLLLVDPNGDQTHLPAAQTEGFLGPVRDDPAGEMRFQFGQILAGSRPQTAEAVMAALAATPPEALVGALESAATWPTAAELERYPGPMLSVITPLNSLPISLHRLLPGRLPTVTMLGSSHWVMMDKPAELAPILGSFLAEL